MPEPDAEMRQWPRCMDPGSLREHVVGFTNHLAALGHTRLTVGNYEDAACHFAEWLQRSDIPIVDVDEKVVERFAGHRCKCSGFRRYRRVSAKYARRVRRFLCFLAQKGALRPLTPKASKVITPRVREFQDFLRHHRGLSELTISRHGRMIMKLLSDLGEDPESYNAGLIRRAILAEAGRSSRRSLQTITTALKSYLRYLARAVRVVRGSTEPCRPLRIGGCRRCHATLPLRTLSGS